MSSPGLLLRNFKAILDRSEWRLLLTRLPRENKHNPSHRPSKEEVPRVLVLIIDIAKGGHVGEGCENELQRVEAMGKSSPRAVNVTM